MPDPARLWWFLPIGYVLTIAIEGPILLIGLAGLRMRERLIAALWLTACTYPIVVLVLPLLIPEPRWMYLAVAETFAPLAECGLFYLAYGGEPSQNRLTLAWNLVVIVLANLASFLLGGALLDAWPWLAGEG